MLEFTRARLRPRVPALAGVVLFASAFAASTGGAATPDETRDATLAPADLRTALYAVWQDNPAVRAAEARRDAALARARAAAQPLYNPDLELVAENADVDTRSVGISQTLDWSGRRRARSGAADADARAAEAEREDARQRIAIEWLRGFAALQAAREQSALGAERVRTLDTFAGLAARRHSAGDIAAPERDLAQLAAQEARAQQAQLAAAEAKAQQGIAALGGRVDALPVLPERMPPPADAQSASLQLASLPAQRRARAETEAAYARVTMAERERRPDPTISLSGGRVTSGPLSDRLIGVAVKIPLFVRNSYAAEADAARAGIDDAEARQRELAVRAGAELDQAAASYNALRDAWLAWRSSGAPSVDARAALLQRLWEAGELSTADYLVQIKQGLDTALSAAALRGNAWQAFADWLAASGRLDAWLAVTADPEPPRRAADHAGLMHRARESVIATPIAGTSPLARSESRR